MLLVCDLVRAVCCLLLLFAVHCSLFVVCFGVPVFVFASTCCSCMLFIEYCVLLVLRVEVCLSSP